MIVLGISGKIGTGKSTIINSLKDHSDNIFVIDSDSYAKNLYTNKKFTKRINKHFPEVVIKKENNLQIDFKKLRQTIFLDYKKNIVILGKITHGYVKKYIKKVIKSKKAIKNQIIIIESAILYQSKLNKLCNYVILVTCNQEIQKSRVIKRSNISEELFNTILEAQSSKNNNPVNPDFVIDTTDINLDNLFQEIKKILNKISNDNK